MGKFNKENEKKLKELHSQGLSNRQIAEKLNVHFSTVANWLKKIGLETNTYNQQIEMVSDAEAKCSKCCQIKSIDEFQYGRKGTSKEYKFSYCNECRKNQAYDNLNKDFNKYLKDKYNRWKRTAKDKGINFTITFEEIQEIYNIQNGLCFYSDYEMEWGVNEGWKKHVISIDKVIPESGYVKGNVVLCSNKFNTVKSDLTLEELEKFIPIFYNKIKNCKWLKIFD